MAAPAVFTEPDSARAGIICTVVAGCISLAAVVGFLLFMIVRAFRHPAPSGERRKLMGDKHMTAYFYSLLFSSILKALSVIMSAKWVSGPMMPSAFCSLQAAFKLTGNVGTAVWSMVISLHIFNLLFLSLKPIKWSLPAVLASVWSLLLADVLIGPVAFGSKFYGPFDGVDRDDGTSCWITDHHPNARFLLEYFLTGLAPFVSVIILTFTLLHLRGNIYFTNGRLKLRLFLNGDDAWHIQMMRDDLDKSIIATVQRMIWFPMAYFLLWSPVMVSRLMQFAGDDQPFGFVAFALTVYALTGFVDVVLFVLTRKIIMPDGVVTPACVQADNEKDAQMRGGTPMPMSGAMATGAGAGAGTARAVKKGTNGAPISGPRPLVLQTSGLDRTASASSASTYDSTSRLLTASTSLQTGATIPTFLEPPRDAPLPPVPSLRAQGPPTALSDVSMIMSARARPRSPGSAASSAKSYPTNFMSMGSDTPRSMAQSTIDAYDIMSAYGHTPGATSRPSRAQSPAISAGASAGTGTDLDIASAHTFGNAVRVAGPNVVEPLHTSETFKADLYGARFSLVAGPLPAYNYERSPNHS
ncbi:hypothetical protein AURDEDRAFT_112865 [Auricularia subglabra TFB-10046 SS5]|nr:hypothetical protein AURDEDRAFT_112865 [Auricularia subglabra TFB-10046 SS5]